eukprot:2412239-Pyramimonas_sp.AAC.1
MQKSRSRGGAPGNLFRRHAFDILGIALSREISSRFMQDARFSNPPARPGRLGPPSAPVRLGLSALSARV